MRFATPARHEWEGRGESSAAIVAMGLALAVAGVVQSLAGPVSQPIVAFELFVSLLVPTGLATGGYWLASRNVSPDRRRRAAIRVSIGSVVACGLAAWLTVYVTLEGGTIRDPLSLTTTLAAVGGTTGFATAVREPLDVASVPSTDATGTAPAAGTESSLPVESTETTTQSTETTAQSAETLAQSTATADATTESPMERPTAAAATAAIDPSSDAVAAPETSTTGATATAETSRTADTPTTAESRASSAVWRDTDPLGRTAAPARPAQRSERTAVGRAVHDPVEEFGRDAVDASVPDSVDDTAVPRDPIDTPTPARDLGVDTVTAVPSTVETVLGVLQRERARITLAVCYHEWDGEERSVDALARAVSYHVDADPDAVEAGLRHATLPELREIRAVDWDPYTERVAAAEHAVFEEGVREASVLLESFEPGTR